MSSLLVINPPFRFEGTLQELNSKFKALERFDVIYHSETLSKSTNYCFNLIGSICGYIGAVNHSDAIVEKQAIVEEALRESLKQYKLKVDATVKNITEKINRSLATFKKEIEKIIEKLRCEYRIMREKIRERLEREKIINRIREELKRLYLEIRNIIKITLDTFRDKYSNYSEYTKLNDENLELEKRYVNLIKSEVI